MPAPQPITALADSAAPTTRLYAINRRHLDELTGEHGIFQYAAGKLPDPTRGHSLDDVARALRVDILHSRTLGWHAVAESARRNLRFLEDAFDEPSGRFMSFRQADGQWVEGLGSNDSLGRAMLALGETIAGAHDARLVERAIVLFGRALKQAGKVVTPRAQASVILGCAAMTQTRVLMASAEERDAALDTEAAATLRRMATGLHARFLDFAQPGWPWPEEALTFENALLPHALILAGGRILAETMQRVGLQILDWLIAAQTAPEGHLSPVGTGTWVHRGEKAKFDQQPIEATALILAAEAAYTATGDPRYAAAMEQAYAWFLGANDLKRQVARPARGASSDGLTATGASPNESAEATLMWLMASEHMRLFRDQPVRARVATPGRRSTAPALAPTPV
jgi:hypothetical protein